MREIDMHLEPLIANALGFLLMFALPSVFFRKDGTFNLRWIAAGAPFVACFGSVIAALLGGLRPVDTEYNLILGYVGLVFSIGAIALIALTLGTHRIPIALWHQENDAPRSIVTWGAYQRIRHPFYSSFLTLALASILVLPHPITAACAALGFMSLGLTARREERRLLASDFGDEYRAYMAKTGRFVPGVGRSAS